MRHCWLAAVVALTAAMPLLACRRAADAPLPQQQLFPDTTPTGAQGTEAVRGGVARAETVPEVEPNDSAPEAQVLAASVLVPGQLQGAAAVADPAPPSGKRTKSKGTAVLDQDWYRLPAIPPGHVAHIELRDGPACGELELYDDSGRNVLRRAQIVKTSRPVLPAIGPGAHASLVRVVCKGKEGGPYTLALFTRPQLPGEEVEPNDDATMQAAAWPTVAPMQGTLAPAQDTDTFVVDWTGRDILEVQSLSMTGMPDVEWSLTLLDPQTRQPLLQRKGGKGEGCIVPNLDLARLPQGTLLQLRATAGQAPDTPYALGIQPLLPPGCSRQADCRERVPGEREPNDTGAVAQALTLAESTPLLLAGIIDSADDIDQFQVQGAPGQVVSVRLEAPASLAVRLQMQGMAMTAAAGQAWVVAGVPLQADGKLAFAVAADKPKTWARNEAYRLTVSAVDGTAWEQESGDETATSQLWTGGGLLQTVAAGEAGWENGGWRRRGVLATATDRDAFGLDLRGEAAPLGLELVCNGDGAPGLHCEVLDFQGRPLLQLAAPPDGEARTPLALPPGAYRVAVNAAAGRPSLRPYGVAIQRVPANAGLPLAATATAP